MDEKTMETRKLSLNLPPIIPSTLLPMEIDLTFNTRRRSITMYQNGKTIAKRSLVIDSKDFAM